MQVAAQLPALIRRHALPPLLAFLATRRRLVLTLALRLLRPLLCLPPAAEADLPSGKGLRRQCRKQKQQERARSGSRPPRTPALTVTP